MSQPIIVIVINGDSHTDFSIIREIVSQAQAGSGHTDLFERGLQRYQESVSAGKPMSDRELARYLGQTGTRLARKIKAHVQRTDSGKDWSTHPRWGEAVRLYEESGRSLSGAQLAEKIGMKNKRLALAVKRASA